MVHKFEDEYKRKYLKRLNVEDGFKIMEDLYQFAVMGNRDIARHKITKARMWFLIEERARFRNIA